MGGACSCGKRGTGFHERLSGKNAAAIIVRNSHIYSIEDDWLDGILENIDWKKQNGHLRWLTSAFGEPNGPRGGTMRAANGQVNKGKLLAFVGNVIVTLKDLCIHQSYIDEVFHILSLRVDGLD